MHDALPLFLPIRKRGPVMPARLALPRTRDDAPTPIVVERPPPARPLDSIDDAHLLAILAAPLKPGETAALAYARKERELAAAFARLTVVAADTLRKRLAAQATDDELAQKFARLTVERRTRLVQSLATGTEP